MGAQQSDVAAGPAVNADVVQGLRDLADFLEAHPELSRFHGFAYATASGREEMEHFAGLVTDPTEDARYGSVHIKSQVNERVSVEMSASIRTLGGREVKPEYEYDRIIGGGES